MEKILIFVFVHLILAFFLAAKTFAFVTPQDQRIDWSNAGIPDGIKEYPVGVNIMDFGVKADGKTDDFLPLMKAIAACEPGKAVIIPSGNYLIKSSVSIGKPIVLRGEGKKKTYLIFDFEGDPSVDALSFVSNNDGGWQKALTGIGKGSIDIRVDNTSQFKQTKFAEIQEDNDPEKMYTSPNWNQSWAQDAVGQIFKVREIKTDSIVIDEPLHITFNPSLNPIIRPLNLLTNAGIENMHLKRVDKGDGNMITIKYAAYCWVKNVESEYIVRSHVSIEESYKCEIRECYFHHAYDYGGSGHGYGVEMKHHTSNCLAENNSFFHLRHSMMVHIGANGNVFGYNISKETFANGDNTPGVTICDISVHGHYPFMNLFEGNTVQKIEISDYWGPCGPGNTFFRNKIENGGILIKDASNYQNLIGNIFTSEKQTINVDKNVDKKSLLIYGNRGHKTIEKDTDMPDTFYKKTIKNKKKLK